MVGFKVLEANTTDRLNEQIRSLFNQFDENSYSIKPYDEIKYLNNHWVMTFTIERKINK